jgi:hypothetical protein
MSSHLSPIQKGTFGYTGKEMIKHVDSVKIRIKLSGIGMNTEKKPAEIWAEAIEISREKQKILKRHYFCNALFPKIIH